MGGAKSSGPSRAKPLSLSSNALSKGRKGNLQPLYADGVRESSERGGGGSPFKGRGRRFRKGLTKNQLRPTQEKGESGRDKWTGSGPQGNGSAS